VKILTPAGYRVHPADSGELALVAIAANPPDLILLDVRMKGLDGLEICRRIKAREETRHIPVILISAFAEVEEWVAGLQLGAADYITKPFQPAELLTRVRTHLALGRANASLEQQAASLRTTNEQLQSEALRRQRIEGELRQSLDRVERSHRAMLSALEDKKRAEVEREKLIRELQEALVNVKQLSGLLPICASCKNIRDDKGYWTQIEAYIHDHSQAEFTHGICPDCRKRLYGDILEKERSPGANVS
jgi:DNA-binding response OmpR family regulator